MRTTFLGNRWLVVALVACAQCVHGGRSTHAADCDAIPCANLLQSDGQSAIRTSPLIAQLKPDRVLILTSLDRQDRLKEQAVLARELASQLRSQAGFDAVVCRDRVCDDMNPIRTGRFDERTLIELGRTYSVDAVLYCTVQSIEAYRPMKLEIEFLLVNIDQSVAVASGNQQLDLSDIRTEGLFLHSLNADPDIGTMLSNSPTRMIGFGASRLAASLAALWR